MSTQLWMFEELPGDPRTLTEESTRLATIAETLRSLSIVLNNVADDDLTIGKSVDAMRERTRVVSADLVTVEPRYTETSAALTDYAVVLEDTQSRVRELRTEVAAHEHDLAVAEPTLRDLEHRTTMAAMAGEDPGVIEDLLSRQSYYRRQVADAQAGLAAAWQRYNQALEERNLAAEAAATRIRMELGTLNDGFFDHVGAVLEDLGGFVAAVGEWIVRVLDTVLTTLLLIVIVVVSLVVVLAVVLALFPVFLTLITSGALTMDGFVEVLVGVALVVVPLLTGAVAALMLREALTPTPTVRPVTDTLGGRLVNKQGASDYQYLFQNNGKLDENGGRDRTVVEVVRVLDDSGAPALDEFGNPIWRVTLPSTQDWQLLMGGAFGDAGAVNDLGSNLTLILTPDQKAAYERAVLQAMSDAGIGPDDSVMLAGWSQGGILAGAMASDPDSPFNIRAIAVAGAPIDHMPIPPTVSVLAIQHDGDHVPRLDGTPPRQGPNWVTITEPSGRSGYPHNADYYAQTAARVDSERQSMFFSDFELAYQYEFAEAETAVK
ncbi:hypothetical protein [Cryobacterium sp. BB307]|uniref:hypothetical protein n=1 Tax=Cryobacterium sp. BB307 TaxID=2716317 RepID=UPI0014488BE0|nr:hypothetical protein [Cryobacterium sp. BB307]